LSFSEDAFWGFLVSHSRDSIVCMEPGIFELYKVRPNIVVAYTIGSGQACQTDPTDRVIERRRPIVWGPSRDLNTAHSRACAPPKNTFDVVNLGPSRDSNTAPPGPRERR
jgi:hypothetical protein